MSKAQIITTIITALFNIAVIILNAFGDTKVAETLQTIAPEVNILVLALLSWFGITALRKDA